MLKGPRCVLCQVAEGTDMVKVSAVGFTEEEIRALFEVIDGQRTGQEW